ncbi:MAG: ComEC/Rec2 family competence protein [Clostridia bacterium]
MFKKRIKLIMVLIAILFIWAVQLQDERTVNTIVKQEGQGLAVHYIDVGQADSILVNLPGTLTMLIDAGNNTDEDKVISYLKSQGIERIDILIGTHPHEDHIGALDSVIKSFDIGKIYMPKISHASKTFKDVLLAVQEKDYKVSSPVTGENIFEQDSLKLQFLAPLSTKYEELNNYSIVTKLTYGDTSFLFTGDAEDVSEKEMLKAFRGELKADVLKVGHHGSASSTTTEFLKAVSPAYALISVEDQNSYGHPHKEVIEKLDKSGVKTFRTDKQGTVVMMSDGKQINVITEK